MARYDQEAAVKMYIMRDPSYDDFLKSKIMRLTSSTRLFGPYELHVEEIQLKGCLCVNSQGNRIYLSYKDLDLFEVMK